MTDRRPYLCPYERAGFILLWILTIEYALLSTGFLFGIPVGRWQFPAAVILGTLAECRRDRASLKGAFTALAALTGALILSAWISDFTFDSYAYHMEGAALFMNGWNPLVNTAEYEVNIWDLHYPKGVELTGAGIAMFLDNIESGKAVNIIMALSMFFMLGGTLHRLLPGSRRSTRRLLALLALCNPVALIQMFTYYTDLWQYYLCVWMIMLMLRIGCGWGKERGGRSIHGADLHSLTGLAVLTVLAIAVKWTAAFYVAYAWAFSLIWFMWHRRWNLCGVLTLTGLTGLVIGTIVCGWHPYVTNAVAMGNPFYPLLGEGAVDIMAWNTPEIYDGHNRVRNFLTAYHDFQTNVPSHDERTGGFGPFTFPLLILSFIAAAIPAKRTPKAVWYIMTLTLLSCFCFEQTWWARYIVQLWIIPVTGVVALAMAPEKTRPGNILFRTILTLAFIPSLLGMTVFTMQQIINSSYRDILHESLKGSGARMIVPAHGETATYAITRKLHEQGIHVERVTPEETQAPYMFFYPSCRMATFAPVEMDARTLERMKATPANRLFPPDGYLEKQISARPPYRLPLMRKEGFLKYYREALTGSGDSVQ